MNRQYYTSPFQGSDNPLRVGTVPVGAIFYLPAPQRGRPERASRWIVEAFLNGTQAAAARHPQTGLWEDRYISGRSDLAVMRSLRDGRRTHLSVRLLEQMVLEGNGPGTYPDLPDVSRFHNRYRNRSPVT
ncbi:MULTISPECIES: hypothetical protein [Acetobacter]|uniref:Uncharacterized protein n=3 Tax=Acetobacter TaxID=434 RepID=A0A511XNM1_9PROT|nr:MULTISPECIES: hypothetical protein [Acetobacter]MBB3884389.1 hypothetical protein [Acetobacter oeni]NHO20334.1 hypothetical protein [Acetobacter oeni]NHO33520.1 hypothetical protein [Acetobacter fallax]NHO37137.1 hypothetical protein [Acetobacter fallax]GEN64525.1 hypothetical protein AOE01nite_27490 [Acetobacter oeni]